MTLRILGKKDGKPWYFIPDGNTKLVPVSDDEMAAIRTEQRERYERMVMDILNDTKFWDRQKL